MSTTTSAPSETAAASQRRWWVVGLLALGMVIAYVDRVNLTVALPEMSRGLNLDRTQQGMALSAFFWTYTLFQIPAGLMVDRHGVRMLYFYGFLLWSVASAATTLTTGLAALIAIRLLVGTGESVVTSCSLRYISAHFEEKQRGLAVGIYMTGTKVGPAIGLPIAAFLVHALGWRAMFLILGLGCLLWLIPWMKWVPASDPSAQARSAATSAALGQRVTLSQALRYPVMWGIIGGTYCYMYFVYYCMTWMPIYFQERHGMSITQMGWYSGVSFGGMAAVAALSGWAADRLIARGFDAVNVRKGFTIAGFVAAATQTFSVFTDSTSLMIFFTIFSLCGLGLATANYWALTQTLMPGALPVAIQNTAANLAGVVAPWLTGWMIQQTGSFEAPIKAVGVWLVLGICCYVFVVKRRAVPAPA